MPTFNPVLTNSGRLEGIEELEEEGSAAKVFKKPIYTSSKVSRQCFLCPWIKACVVGMYCPSEHFVQTFMNAVGEIESQRLVWW